LSTKKEYPSPRKVALDSIANCIAIRNWDSLGTNRPVERSVDLANESSSSLKDIVAAAIFMHALDKYRLNLVELIGVIGVDAAKIVAEISLDHRLLPVAQNVALCKRIPAWSREAAIVYISYLISKIELVYSNEANSLADLRLMDKSAGDSIAVIEEIKQNTQWKDISQFLRWYTESYSRDKSSRKERIKQDAKTNNSPASNKN
jgi:hypothetical protein